VYQANVTECTTLGCTIPEGLLAKNISLTLCGAPLRDRSDKLVSSLWASVGLALVFVVLRFFQKLVIAKGTSLGFDDILVVVTLVFGVSAALVHVFGSIPQGLGKDIWTQEPDAITDFGAAFYHSCWTYFAASALIKLTMIAFFMRIFTHATAQRLLKGSFIFTSLYGAAFVLTAIFQCRPLHYFWTGWDGLHKGTCANANAISWANAIGGIVLDLWILGIPLWQLRHLQLHWKRKVAVLVMLLVGAAVTVVSILRLQSLVHFASSQNTTWDFYHIAIWSGLEISIGIACSCLPTVRLLLIKVFPGLGDPGSGNAKGGYVYHSKDRSGGSNRQRQRSILSSKTSATTFSGPTPWPEPAADRYHIRLKNGSGDVEANEMHVFSVENSDPYYPRQ
jgi:hypothetical protein